MTTEVIIKACANWSVLVQPLSVSGGACIPATIIEAGHTGSAYVHGSQDLFIQEIDPNPTRDLDFSADRLLAFFTFQHLPEALKVTSMPFAFLALRLVKLLPAGPERTTCLRKLLEAKDCAVRAAIEAQMKVEG